jgi:hypothetical protein
MKTKFRYETPMLVDLSAESALGTTCSGYGGNVDWMCGAGSCPMYSQCATGTRAQTCYSNGSSACEPAGNPNCMACCQTGSSPESVYTCYCIPGYGATWTCGYGGNDGTNCSSGGNYPNCY